MRLFLVGLVVAACACGGAAAQRKVAFLGVERPSGKVDRELEAWVVERVEVAYDVVRVDGDGGDELTDKRIRKLAKRAGADAVVYGELSKKKKGTVWLTVLVHDGRSGELIETHEPPPKRKREAPPPDVADGEPDEPEPEMEPEPEPEPEPPPRPAKATKAKAKPSKPSKPVFEPADEPAGPKYDENGQALDDEMPDSLKK